MNVPDADAGVEDKSDNFGLYKTNGNYITDSTLKSDLCYSNEDLKQSA